MRFRTENWAKAAKIATTTTMVMMGNDDDDDNDDEIIPNGIFQHYTTKSMRWQSNT